MPRAVFWASPASAPLHLSPLPGDLGAKALAINGDGFVAGISSWSGQGQRLGVVWHVTVDEHGVATATAPTPLFPLPGDTWSSAESVETLTDGTVQVVGKSVFSGDTEAVVWTLSFNADGTVDGGTPVSLGGIGTTATGIN